MRRVGQRRTVPARIEPVLPVQRGSVSLRNLQVVDAIAYVAENGCIAFLRFPLDVKTFRLC